MAGFNTEHPHKGSVFHVQTQDYGSNAHFIESVIYKSGRVLASRKTFYTSLLGEPGLKEKIESILKDQHKTILDEISKGRFDHL